MRHLTKGLILLATMLCTVFFSSATTVIELDSVDLSKFKTLFIKLENHLSETENKLWGHPLYGPILLVKQDRSIIANQADSAGMLKAKGSVFTGILPPEINIANTALNWNGTRWSMIRLPLPKDPLERMNLIAHELFHRIQPELGFGNVKLQRAKHLEEMQARVLLKLELAALKKVVLAKESAKIDKHVRDALCFRFYRYQLYPDAQNAENGMELLEGLPEFTGSILSGRTDEQLKEHYVQAIDFFYQNPSFVRSFAYYTTPMYGYLLYTQDKSWVKSITSSTNLSTFIAEFFHFTPSADLQNTVNRLKENYGFTEIQRVEKERERLRKETMAGYREKFAEKPTLTIVLEDMSIGFNPSNLIPLDELGTVYPTLRVSDNWGILTAENGALIDPSWKTVTISAPEKISERPIKGDGWQLTLKDGYHIVKHGKNYSLEKSE